MARKRRKRNASRGSVNNIILKTLANGDKYGYEIIKEVEEYSEGKIQLKQPSLYSSLTRFEEKQFVTSYWGDSDIGGRRHYYHLTDTGYAYYKKFVLKEDDEDNNDDILEEEDINVLTDHGIEETIINSQQQEELLVNKTLNENINNEEKIILNEIDNNEIPAIVNFEPQIINENNEVIESEPRYHEATPIENMIIENVTNNSYQESPIFDENSQTSNLEYNTENPWQQLANNTKISNKNFSQSSFNKLYIKKPKKEQHIIKDVDGIYKLRDDDYVPEKTKYTPIIIDNVGKRSTANNTFGYTTYTSSDKETKKDITELSDDEKLKRNENFLAKFNLLTKSKMKPVSTPAPKPVEDKPEKAIDYRSKLYAIFDDSNDFELDDTQSNMIDNIEENNIFNYTEQDTWNNNYQLEDENITDEEDKYIEFDCVEQFEVKQDNKQYVEEISNFTTPVNKINMSRYEHTTNAVLVDKTYLLNNKLKFVFGIILSLIMLAEITSLWFVFKKFDLINGENNKTILISAYVVVGLFALFTIIPYIFNSNSHKANNFKFKYSFWFGILTFLVSTILIYCINALSGFELDNIRHFAVKLFIPIILVFNFVISPVVYGFLVKSKHFYD